MNFTHPVGMVLVVSVSVRAEWHIDCEQAIVPPTELLSEKQDLY